MKRDLSADIAICNAATSGEWEHLLVGNDIAPEYISSVTEETIVAEAFNIEDARFIAEARVGWPEAIRRAMDAEEALRWLIAAYDCGDLRQTRMSSGTDYVIQRARTLTSKE